ncbi:flagellar hook-length control protein FliK [Modicisalibacter xianhensis]|uniref:Flagellar hook-length control protein FliK n=1 Tax=Modicisalibacter xianhensis TaxID=442341 RepID=A0A1I3A4T7_9GAMM|nr:flagellar hook-length control protein FliK [Halomonas xianhensis]SFH45028.1 flagellar hook-length control protein FliK [Halomonas xianhensis]
MELSQLLAGSNAAASLPQTHADGKTGSKGDAEFARLFKQAGEAGKGKTTDAPTLASATGKTLLTEANTEAGVTTSPPSVRGDAKETDPAELSDTLLTQPGELAPLAQQVNQAIEGNLAENAQNEQLSQDAWRQGQAEPGDPVLGTLAPMPGSGDLADIRQRLDMIASAQRGDALPAQPGAALATNAAQLMTQVDARNASGERVMATADAQAAGLRHQQLTAQGMHTLTQQDAPVQPLTPAAPNFTDAIAAVAADEPALLSRHGPDPATNLGMPAATSPLGSTANGGNGIAPNAMPATPTLAAPLASAQWQQGLGQQLVALHQRGGQQVELHLHPAELGPLSISLKVDDQLAQAQFFSANPQVRAAVEQAIPQLREALEESGIQLGEAMVGEHQQRDESRDQSRGERAMAGRTGDSRLTSADESATAPRTTTIVLDDNAIDLYA